jgi:hypothetical protein
VRALGRRRGDSAGPTGPSEFRLGALRLDRRAAPSTTASQVLELTPREAALLQALMARPGHAVAKERLFELVFPGETDVQYEADRGGGVSPAQEAGADRGEADDAARARLPASRPTDGAGGPDLVAPLPAAGHPAAGAAAGGAQRREPVPRDAAGGEHRLRPHPAGLGQGHRRTAGRQRLRPRRRLRATVPYSALEAFEADNRSQMFYRVSNLQGELVSGYGDLPFWRGALPARPPYAALVDFYDDRFRDEAVRVAVLLQPVASGTGRGMAVVQVAETLELRQTPGTRDPARHLVAPGAAGRGDRAGGGRRGAARHAAGAQPVGPVAGPGRGRPDPGRRARRAARAAAAGGRDQRPDGAPGPAAGQPEALRARHGAPAAHAAGGAQDAGAIGPARRRRAAAGAARSQCHRRPRHRAGQPDAVAGQGGTAAPAGRRRCTTWRRHRARDRAGPVAAGGRTDLDFSITTAGAGARTNGCCASSRATCCTTRSGTARLGLAICQEIVRALGGRIDLDNRGVQENSAQGVGLDAVVRLPVYHHNS